MKRKLFSFTQPLDFDIKAKDEETAIELATQVSLQVAKFLDDLQSSTNLPEECEWIQLGDREIIEQEDCDDEEE